MDLETGLYHDNPEFDDVVDRLSNELFQISSTNGKISELLRKGARNGPATAGQQLSLVQQNQQLFRQLRPEIEEMQTWENPSPSQKYSQHKIAADFGRLFVEFTAIQQKVIDSAKTASKLEPKLEPKTAAAPSVNSNIEMDRIDETEQQERGLQEQGSQEQEQEQEQVLAFEDQLAMDEISYQQGLVAEREHEIENVAQGMNELNDIYANLGAIVREQGVSLDNIEANLYSTVTSVRNGSQQLTKAHSWQRRSTGRMCCFLIVLLVVATFIGIAVSV